MDYAGDEGVWIFVGLTHHKDTKITEFHKEICKDKLGSFAFIFSYIVKISV